MQLGLIVLDKPFHPETLTGQILMFLARMDGKWCTWGTSYYMPSVSQVFPIGTSAKVQLRFMQTLQRKNLVSGCDCGCRGDYTVTEKGLDFLANSSKSGRQERERYEREGLPFVY